MARVTEGPPHLPPGRAEKAVHQARSRAGVLWSVIGAVASIVAVAINVLIRVFSSDDKPPASGGGFAGGLAVIAATGLAAAASSFIALRASRISLNRLASRRTANPGVSAWRMTMRRHGHDDQ